MANCNLSNVVLTKLEAQGLIDANKQIISDKMDELQSVISRYNNQLKDISGNRSNFIFIKNNKVEFDPMAIANISISIKENFGGSIFSSTINNGFATDDMIIESNQEVQTILSEQPVGSVSKNELKFLIDRNKLLLGTLIQRRTQVEHILNNENLTLNEYDNYQRELNHINDYLRSLNKINELLKHSDLTLNSLLQLLESYKQRISTLLNDIENLELFDRANAFIEIKHLFETLNQICDVQNNPLIDFNAIEKEHPEALEEIFSLLSKLKRSYYELENKYASSSMNYKRDIVSDGGIIKQPVNQKITFDQIFGYNSNGLTDIDVFTEFFTTATLGGLSEDLPQQLIEQLVEKNFAIQQFKNAKLKGILEEVRNAKFNDKVKEVGGQQIFLRHDAAGLKTSNLVKRFSQLFDDTIKAIRSDYDKLYRQKELKSDIPQQYNSSGLKILSQRLSKIVNILDVKKLFDINEFNINIQDVFDKSFLNSLQKDENYIKQLETKYGKHFTQELIEDQKKKIIRFFRATKIKQEEFELQIALIESAAEELQLTNPSATDEIKKLNDQKKILEQSYNDFLKYENPFVINSDNIESENTFNYLTLIPKENKGFYDENFKKIDSDEVLYKGYQILKQIFKESQSRFKPVSENDNIQIIINEQSLFEMLNILWKNDEYNFSQKLKQTWDAMLQNIADQIIKKREESSFEHFRNHYTGLLEITPNHSFYKTYSNKVQKDLNLIIQQTKYLAAQINNSDVNKFAPNNIKLKYLNRLLPELNKILPISIDTNLVNAYTNPVTGNIRLKDLIENILINQELESEQLNILLDGKLLLDNLTTYDARLNTQPLGLMLLDELHQIKRLNKNTTGMPKKDPEMEQTGIVKFQNSGELRTASIKRADDFFMRSILGYSTDTTLKSILDTSIIELQNAIDTENSTMNQERENDFKEYIKNFDGKKYQWFKIKSTNEVNRTRKHIIKLQELLTQFKNNQLKALTEYNNSSESEIDIMFNYDEEVKKLNTMYNSSIEKLKIEYEDATIEIQGSMIAKFLFSWLRFNMLGYNVNSAFTNYMEGQIANIEIAQSGLFFNTESYYKATSLINSIGINDVALTTNKSKLSRKLKSINRIFNVIQDSSELVDKNADYSTTQKNIDRLKPYFFTSRVEYANQMPLVLAVLYDTKLKDKSGNESNLFDALNEDGKLKEGFRTIDNIRIYEDSTSNTMLSIRNTMNDAIIKTHGDYRTTTTPMIMANYFGRIFVMIKRWAISYLVNKYGNEHYDLSLGKKVKGYTNSTTIIDQMVMTTMTSLMLGSVIPFLSIPLALSVRRKIQGKSNIFTGTTIDNLKETFTGLALGTLVSSPFHRLYIDVTGKNIDIKKYIKHRATELDIQNTARQYANFGITINLMIAQLIIRGLIESLSDDEDDEDDTFMKSVLIYSTNKVRQLSNNQTQMTDFFGLWDFITELPFVNQVMNKGKAIKNIFSEGVKESGPYKGTSNTEYGLYKFFENYPLKLFYHAYRHKPLSNWDKINDLYFPDQFAGISSFVYQNTNTEINKQIEEIKSEAKIRFYNDVVNDINLKKTSDKAINELFKKQKNESPKEQLIRISQYDYDDFNKEYQKELRKKKKSSKKKSE